MLHWDNFFEFLNNMKIIYFLLIFWIQLWTKIQIYMLFVLGLDIAMISYYYVVVWSNLVIKPSLLLSLKQKSDSNEV